MEIKQEKYECFKLNQIGNETKSGSMMTLPSPSSQLC